ncbi:MAG: GTP cyclohydrolase I FolE2 [Clostridiales bacterium]|nr:GTP cyclohydrolase I FolE2 [Clostridiales bacterium]
MKDVQIEMDDRGVYLQKVGIKELVRPIILKGRDGEMHSVAKIGFNVSLEKEKRAIHMSRLIEILDHWDTVISYESIQSILNEIKIRMESNQANLLLSFMYFLSKTSPVSNKTSLLHYQCKIDASDKDDFVYLTVEVPITSVCPCSKSISDYGAHNQRGVVTVTVRTNDMSSIEDIIHRVEAVGSMELYSLLKRVDEKYVTEVAYDNPKFVEDIARDVAIQLQKDQKYQWYQMEVENYESIHNHNAYVCTGSE